MSREPRAPLTASIVRKGEGAIAEPMPEATQHAPSIAAPVASAPAKEATDAFTVRVPESMTERLRVLSFQTKRRKGDLIVEALARLLDSAGV